MSEIRPLSTEDFGPFTDIVANAYPGMKMDDEAKERARERLLEMQEKEPTVTLYGLFREGQLLGGMRLHDFAMNFLQVRIPAGGVGLVAVGLAHKKEHVAKEMMEFFLRHYRERGAPLALLYPFRPDFYKRMSFGYGTKMSQYRVRPAALPKGPSKAQVRYLGEEDKQALLDCYDRVLDHTHGMIEKSEHELTRLVTKPEHHIVGCEKDGRIRGYMVFTFEGGENWLINDIYIREFIFESREALSQLLTFLHTQADQIRHVIFETQDESFHHLLLDPRNGSPTLQRQVYHESNIQGIGIMYRVIDVPGIFHQLAERDFGGQTCALKLVVEDSFLPENAGCTLVAFNRGRLELPFDGRPDVEVRLDVSEFSSLLVGTVSFRWLYRHGLAEVSDDAAVPIIDRIFAVEDKPVCTTPF